MRVTIKRPVRLYIAPQKWVVEWEERTVERLDRSPVPPGKWPKWAQEMATKRLPEDRGVGDTIEHEIGLVGTPAFMGWYRAKFGRRPCPQCPARWNRQYPYVQGA